jgi:DNA repair exonuclease SbcCD ATPase subunit
VLSKAASIEEEIGRMESELSDKEAVLKVAAKPISLVFVVATSVGIFILFLLIGALRGELGLMMALGVLIAILLAAGLYVLSRSRGRGFSGAMEGLEGIRKKLSDLEEEKARLKEEVCLSFPDEEVRALVKTLGMRNLAVQYERFKEAKRTFEDIEKDLLQRRVRARGEGYTAALSEAAVAEAKLEQFLKEERELISLKDEPEKATVMATQARTEVERMEKNLEDLDSELRERQLDSARLSAAAVDSPEVSQEKIRNLEKTLARLTLRRDALKLAVRVLDECVAQYQADSIERVSGRISEAFEGITQGRYKAVRLSPELEPVLETSLETRVGPEHISTGAQDQLYFSMRVAMIEELSGEKGLPLILDDPFVNFDDQRLERARTLLAGLLDERDMQIIIFTHGDRHLAWDANIIRLT